MNTSENPTSPPSRRSRFTPRVRLVAPLVCLALLGGAYAERSRRLSGADVQPYHERARLAINDVRYTIGFWTGADVEVPEAAQQLLKPNALLSRNYVDNDPRHRGPVRVQLLIVQCRDPGDMQGHYPPICYVAQGQQRDGDEKMEFTLDRAGAPLTIRGTEYRFSKDIAGQRIGKAIFNTLLIPGVGTTPDMGGIYRAAEDYRRALYGAAQLQVVMSDEVPPARRREIYEFFLRASETTLRAFLDTGEPDLPAELQWGGANPTATAKLTVNPTGAVK